MRSCKLFLILAAAVIALTTLGCWCENSTNDVEEKNMAVVRHVHAEIA